MKPEIKEIQPEDQWLNYLKPGVQPNNINTTMLLESVGEGKECLFSGKTESNLSMATGENVSELGDYPVDSNTQNILPSNMVTIDKSFLTRAPMAFKVGMEIHSYKFQLFSDEFVYQHNERMVEEMDTEVLKKGIEDPKELFGVWDFLTRNHIKGLGELTFTKSNGTSYSIGVMEALMFFSKKIKKGTEKSSGSLNQKQQRPNLSLA